MKSLVVFTGAGISQESGLETFRDEDGLWEKYNIEDVATIDAWHKNSQLVLEFYNARRKQVLKAKPNLAHKTLFNLEQHFNVSIITQNIDNLHERAGSKNVLHLHGRIDMVKSTITGKSYITQKENIKLGDFCEDGYQLRPDIVWFGEDVPNMITANSIVEKADILLVIGTSLNVYPAAGLVHSADEDIPKFVVDPKLSRVTNTKKVIFINEKATIGVPMIAERLINKYK